MKLKVYDAQGKEIEEIEPKSGIFDRKPSPGAVWRAHTAHQAAQRQGTSSTLTRAEVRGGGRKPHRQKGTGRARQGSSRSPLHPKGGIIFGPKPRDLSKAIPRKMRRRAIVSLLSARAAEGKVKVVEEIPFSEPKTRLARAFLDGLGVTDKALVIDHVHSQSALLAVRNLPKVTLRVAPAFSADDVLLADTVVMTKSAISLLEEIHARG
jgi:large subunit ribosomal protein L4